MTTPSCSTIGARPAERAQIASVRADFDTLQEALNPCRRPSGSSRQSSGRPRTHFEDPLPEGQKTSSAPSLVHSICGSSAALMPQAGTRSGSAAINQAAERTVPGGTWPTSGVPREWHCARGQAVTPPGVRCGAR